MATAMRVSDRAAGEREEVRACEEVAGKEDLPFDFFIRPNIPRLRSNGYFRPHPIKIVALALQPETSVHRQNLPCNKLRRGREE